MQFSKDICTLSCLVLRVMAYQIQQCHNYFLYNLQIQLSIKSICNRMNNSKLVNNNGSLAYSYGITRSNQKDSTMGLNPNLNIQDEYIENLLKQINFLNLEIKLLKQKQGENKNLGIMGLLNRDQQPLVNHAVESNLKFQSMKGNLQTMVSEMMTQNLLLENQNTAVNSQKQFLQEQLKKEEQKNFNHRIQVEKVLEDSNERLKAFNKRYDQLKSEHKRVAGLYNGTDDEHKKTIRNEKIKSLLTQITSNLKKEEDDASQQVLNEKGEVTKANKAKWSSAQNQFKQDPRYVQLSEENVALKQKMRKSDKQLFDLCYKAKQMEELKSLSQRNISVELQLKKQAALQLQKVEDLFTQKKEDFERRLADRKKMSDLQPETKRLESSLASTEKEYDDIKKKNDMSENNYKKLREEILKFGIQLELLKSENKELIQKQNSITPQVNNVEAEMNRQQVDLQIKTRDLEKCKIQHYSSKDKLLKLEEQLRYLTSKHRFLQQNLHVDEDLQNLRIQELKGISQNNSMVNEVINEMMGKFDQMRKFAKDSSAIMGP